MVLLDVRLNQRLKLHDMGNEDLNNFTIDHSPFLLVLSIKDAAAKPLEKRSILAVVVSAAQTMENKNISDSSFIYH